MIDVKNCPLCGSSQFCSLVSRKFNHPDIKDFIDTYYEGRVDWRFLVNELFEVVRCQNCTFIWQRYILDSIGMSKLYSEWASPAQSLAKKKEANIQLYSTYAKQVQYINSFFPERKPYEIKVLDYGCGWGYWCLMAKAHGYCVTGVEISDERLLFARSNSLDMACSYDELSDRKFDFINSEQSFEHIPNPLDNLSNLVGLLNLNGIIRISVPNGINVENELDCHVWKAKKDAIHPLEHINCFTPKTLVYMAEKIGLRQVNSMSMQQRTNIKFKLKEFVKGILGKPKLINSIGTSVYFVKV